MTHSIAYLGATTVEDGLVRFSSSDDFGSGGATFDTNGNDVTFTHALTGSGPITKTGSGKLAFAAVNTGPGALNNDRRDARGDRHRPRARDGPVRPEC